MTDSFPACRDADFDEVLFRSKTAILDDPLPNLGQRIDSRTDRGFGRNDLRGRVGGGLGQELVIHDCGPPERDVLSVSLTSTAGKSNELALTFTPSARALVSVRAAAPPACPFPGSPPATAKWAAGSSRPVPPLAR